MLLQRKVTKEKSPQKPTESFICRTSLRLQAMKLSVRTFRGRPRTQKPVGMLDVFFCIKLFRLAQWHIKISRKNQILSNVLECAKIVRAVREALRTIGLMICRF